MNWLSHLRSHSPRRRSTRRNPVRNRQRIYRSGISEHLEQRTLLTTFYVDNAADFFIETNNGAGGLDNGDIVTWRQGTAEEVTGLTFGTQAFESIPSAVGAAASGDVVQVAPGTFLHSGQMDINVPLTLIGAGQDQTIIQNSGSVTAKEQRTVQINAADVTFQDLTLGGWETAPADANVGFGYLAWMNADDATFDNVRFDANDNRVAIYVGQFDGLTVTDSRFTGTYFRAAIRGGGEDMLISRNSFEESHYWYSPIYFEYGGATSGEISYN